jgi:hypothetical protein
LFQEGPRNIEEGVVVVDHHASQLHATMVPEKRQGLHCSQQESPGSLRVEEREHSEHPAVYFGALR